MQEYLNQYYRPLFFFLLAVLLGLSFYAGMLEGKGSGDDHVVLSCDPHILSALAIPLSTIADANAQSTASDLSAAAIGSKENTTSSLSTPGAQGGKYVGSKNGTKYYGPNCATVKRIKPANYVWFQSAQDAQLQGYAQGKC